MFSVHGHSSIVHLARIIVHMDLEVLGSYIHTLRSERGLTLASLAAAASVSPSMLSAVERGQKAPTITVLSRIAEGLGLPVSRLVAVPDEGRLIVRRAGDQEVIDEPGGWQRAILSPVVPGVNFECIRSTLPPGCDPGDFPAYAPGSHEFVVVDGGTLHLTVGDYTVELGVGDSAYFSADAPHRYTNPGSTPCMYHIAALIMRPRTPGQRTPR